MAPTPQSWLYAAASSGIFIDSPSEEETVSTRSEGSFLDSRTNQIVVGFLVFVGCLVCGPILWISIRLCSRHGLSGLSRLWGKLRMLPSRCFANLFPGWAARRRRQRDREERRRARAQRRQRHHAHRQHQAWRQQQAQSRPQVQRRNAEVDDDDASTGSWTTVSVTPEYQSIDDSPPPYTPTDEGDLPTPPTPVYDPMPPCYESCLRTQRPRPLQDGSVVGESWNPWGRGV